MEWREEIAEGFPPHHKNEPEDLRRDIRDEIADHLICAQEQELRRSGDEDGAYRTTIERFGDPTKVARTLWRDAMKERILRKRVVLVFLCLFGGIALGLLFNWYQQTAIQAKIKKANGEMRSLRTALYDYNMALLHPNMLSDLLIVEGAIKADQQKGTHKQRINERSFRFGRIEEVWPNLTSPIQVVSSIPSDPFDPEGGSFRTATGDGGAFVIIGLGPDKDLDLTPEILEAPWIAEFGGTPLEDVGARLGCPGCGTLMEALRVGTFTYSPTNGVVSNGDLIRIGQ